MGCWSIEGFLVRLPWQYAGSINSGRRPNSNHSIRSLQCIHVYALTIRPLHKKRAQMFFWPIRAKSFSFSQSDNQSQKRKKKYFNGLRTFPRFSRSYHCCSSRFDIGCMFLFLLHLRKKPKARIFFKFLNREHFLKSILKNIYILFMLAAAPFFHEFCLFHWDHQVISHELLHSLQPNTPFSFSS